MTNRVLLCIMDGWGIEVGAEKYDATVLANAKNVKHLEETEKFTKIHADGQYVGLPEGQMGNSEVGHLNLGAGRVVHQDLSKINLSIKMVASLRMKNSYKLLNTLKRTIQPYTYMV